jgi:ferric-dicitrate binding protein FerR (iron transport regulator)
VLGTKFLVQAWPEEGRNVEVVVEEGKVALGEKRPGSPAEQREVIIERNQKGVMTAGFGLEVSDVADLHWHLGWTEGRLVFEDRQLSEIIPRLERWYAVDIQAANNEIAEKRLTAEIDYSQPMMEVLMGIALSLDLEIERDGRTFIFRSAI